MKVIFKTKFGSRLYGTHTDKSDYDFKTVYMPDVKSLLLNKEVMTSHNQRFLADGTVAEDRKSVGTDGYEEEIIPVHKFLRGWAEGQTYVFEMMGAYHAGLYEHASHEFEFLYRNISNIKNENYVKMVSFAKNQIYTITDRIKNYKSFVDAQRILLTQSLTKNLGDCLDSISASYDDQYVFVAGKKYAKNGKVKDALNSVNTQLEKYGTRVTGSIGDSDLKAISHAVRILDEVKMLRENGVIDFPLPKADYYKKIKLGKIKKTADELVAELNSFDLTYTNNLEQLSNVADSLILSLYGIN